MRLILLLSILAAVVSARAQSFSILRPSIGAAGGTSSGGAFAISGAAGEPLASALSGGTFAVAAGFWGVVATVPTPDAPTLLIEPQREGSIAVSWPSMATGFVLEQNGVLDALGWETAPYKVSDDGTRKSVRLLAPTGIRFFRLRN